MLEVEAIPHTRLLLEELLTRVEARLTVVPTAAELHLERGHLLAELNRPREAALAYLQAIESRVPKYPLTTRAYRVVPYRGKMLPVTVLILTSPAGGNAAIHRYLDDQTFLTLQVITDFHEPGLVLPAHQLIINAIGDADSCQSSLKAAQELVAQSKAPVINSPARVVLTDRESISRRLASIPGVRTPKTATFPREFFASNNVVTALKERGLSFPLLLRPPEIASEFRFVRVETPQELMTALPKLPGDSVSVIEFLDARSTAGAIRQYRVTAIDGTFFPVQSTVSTNGEARFSSVPPTDSPEHRTGEKDFLQNMPRVLGAHAMDTLARIQGVLKLDYWSIDFALANVGEIVLFEVGAAVRPPDQGAQLSYQRASAQQIANAVRNMLFDRAKESYLSVLLKDPAQIVSVNNLGAALNLMGHHKAALKVYRDLVAQNPDNPKSHLILAHSLRESCELEEARVHYETVLQFVPDHAEAHLGLAYVLMYFREEAAAWEHHRKAAGNLPRTTFPYREEKDLIRVIVLASPCGGNSPIVRFLDKKTFQTLVLVPDFHDSAVPLPPHELIINATGDADHCGTSLEGAERILERNTGPALNSPTRIRTTGRADNARLLGTLEGVVTPRIAKLSRDILAGPEAVPALERHDLGFPILLRAPGFHGGDHFLRVESPGGLAQAVSTLPGPNLMAIQYLDARDDDGKIRKYRVMMIDGKLYPLHKAVSRGWMIHYFNAEMAHSPEHRAEDEAFLENMPGVLGSRAMVALERIRDALGLDYAGADFSLGREGEVLLFEANATMAVPVPDKEEHWNYRRPHVQRIQDAVRHMLLARANG